MSPMPVPRSKAPKTRAIGCGASTRPMTVGWVWVPTDAVSPVVCRARSRRLAQMVQIPTTEKTMAKPIPLGITPQPPSRPATPAKTAACVSHFMLRSCPIPSRKTDEAEENIGDREACGEDGYGRDPFPISRINADENRS